MCSSVTTYKDYGIYANTALDHQYNFNMLAIVSLVAGTSSITLNCASGSRTYTAAATENVATQSFQLFTGGISNAANIAQTVQSLCHVICGDPSGYWYAEYTSGVNDVPGLFRVWARSPLSGMFWATANNTTTGSQFSPAVPVTGQTIKSSNDARPNRLFYSSFQAPDSVPILNTIDCGRLDQPILRVIAVRDACYIIKTDGIWYLSGLVAPFSLVELDSTCHCVAPYTAVRLNNMLYMLSNQGVVKVSISGVTVISFDIESAIMQSTLPLSNLYNVAFAIAHETQRQYILYLPMANGDTYAKHAYIFHTFIEEYVRSTKPASAGVVLNSNYALYLASGQENALLKARNNGDYTDYSDETVPATIISQTGFVVTVTWTFTLATPTAGLTLHQGASVAKVTGVTFVSGSTWTFTIDRSVTFTPGAATARLPIQSHVRLSPNNLGQSALVKQIYSVTYTLYSNSTTQASIEVSTDEAAAMGTFPISRAIIGGFNSAAWGASGWGDLINPAQSVPWTIDVPVPDNTGETITTGWIHSVSQESYIIAQVSVEFDQETEYEVTA